MRGYFGQAVTLAADFGVGQTGLATVGYKLWNGDGTQYQARTTTGVSELHAGIYKVLVGAGVFTAAFDGYVEWDTGGGSPKYAAEELQMVAAPPAATDYTPTRATKLDQLDAAISTRATPADVDVQVDADLAPLQADVTAVKAKTDLIPAGGPAAATDWTSARAARLDATVSSRASQASVDTVAGYVDTEVAAVKAKTDLLPASPASETTVAAVKAKTDNLPADPADASDIAALLAAIPAAVWASSTRTLSSFGTLVTDIWTSAARTLTSFGTLVADTADAVWNENLSTHLGTGSAGEALEAIGSVGVLIGAGQVTVVSPVALDCIVTLYQGDAYLDTEDRALTFVDPANTWPDLSDPLTEVVMEIGAGSFDGVIVNAGTVEQSVTVDLTTANTVAMEAKEQDYALVALLGGDDRVTLVFSRVTVYAQVG